MKIAHYPLTEDTGGTAYDYSGNGNDGTVNGATQGSAGGILGSTAYDFEEANLDDVTFGDVDALTAGTMGPFTVVAWAKPESADSQDAILGKQNEYRLENNAGTWRFGVYDSTNSIYRNLAGSSVTTGSWAMVAGVWNGTDQILYLDGSEDTRQTPTVALNSTTNGFTIGDESAAGNHYDGLLSNIRVFDHALTSPEIQYMYQRGFRSRIYTAVKDAGSSISPNISNAQYTLNGETVKVYVTGSPDSASPETQAVTLDGTSSFTLSWASTHQFFQITAVAESTDPTTASQIDTLELS